MTVKVTKQEQAEAIEQLRKRIQPGDTIYTTLAHVSRSGMYRAIGVYKIADNRPVWLSRLVARAGGERWDDKHEGVGMSGCGMDMGFALVYNLSRTLFPDGYGCIGKECPSNDHHNGDMDYTPHGHRGPRYLPNIDGTPEGKAQAKESLRHWHKNGGYALRQAWL